MDKDVARHMIRAGFRCSRELQEVMLLLKGLHRLLQSPQPLKLKQPLIKRLYQQINVRYLNCKLRHPRHLSMPIQPNSEV